MSCERNSATDIRQLPLRTTSASGKINEPLTELQRLREISVNFGLPANPGAEAVGVIDEIQAIDREGTPGIWSSGERRPCEAFRSWRTRTAGTGRLNR